MSLIVLKISMHPSGRYSIAKTIDGSISTRLPRKLIGITDKVEFDREIEKLVNKLEADGHAVIVDD